VTVVVDAGAVVDLLLQRPVGAGVRRAMEADIDDLHAPALLDLEVLSALRRLVAADDLGPPRAAQAIDDLLALPILRHDHQALVPRVWELRESVTPYDAAYVALAEALGGQTVLLTLDRRLARAAASHSTVRAMTPG